MTKQELIKLLEPLPDNAEVLFYMGGPFDDCGIIGAAKVREVMDLGSEGIVVSDMWGEGKRDGRPRGRLGETYYDAIVLEG